VFFFKRRQLFYGKKVLFDLARRFLLNDEKRENFEKKLLRHEEKLRQWQQLLRRWLKQFLSLAVPVVAFEPSTSGLWLVCLTMMLPGHNQRCKMFPTNFNIKFCIRFLNGATTLSIITLGIKGLYLTHSISDNQPINDLPLCWVSLCWMLSCWVSLWWVLWLLLNTRCNNYDAIKF
jgi:hypothetical protein